MKQGEKTKKLILDASDELFYHHGYSNTSFSDVVNKTGLSKGNITYHFKNKQDILRAIIDNRISKIDSLIQTWENQSDNPKDRLISFCEMLIDEQDNLEKYGCPIGTLTSEFSKDQPELYEITLLMFQRLKEWLSIQFSILGLANEESEEKALELLSRVQGISVITHVFKNNHFLHIEINRLKDAIINGHFI